MYFLNGQIPPILPKRPEYLDSLTICAVTDNDHIIRQITATQPDPFSEDPVGNPRWDAINADMGTSFWQTMKTKTEAGISFISPKIDIQLKHGIVRSKALIRPYHRTLSCRLGPPVGSRQGYIIISENTFI